MARRASSGANPTAVIVGVVVLGAAFFGGRILLSKKSNTFDGVPKLNIEQLLENGNSLRNNRYVVEGEIDEKLQFSNRGQLVSVKVDGPYGEEFIGIEIPAEFDSMNIETRHKYVFLVEFQHGGIAVASAVESL